MYGAPFETNFTLRHNYYRYLLCHALQVHVVPLPSFLGRLLKLHSDNLISALYAFVSHYFFYISSHQQFFTFMIFCPPRPMGAGEPLS